MSEKVKIVPPKWQANGHWQTVYPSLFRKVKIETKRERLELPDGDFLDLDWKKHGNKKLVIATHGLEGDSTRHYVAGIAKIMEAAGFDGLMWNSRSCSREINRLPRFYHHGDAGDLKYVLEHAIKQGYEKILLVGFSMGGSLTLRLLGEYAGEVPSEVIGAVVASVPLDLPSSVAELDKPGKRFYMERFLKKLGKKIEEKSKMFPDHPILKIDENKKIRNFEQFDNRYTAPLHGYSDAHEFYEKASSKPLLPRIEVPTYIVQAINDPFLSPQCLEIESVTNNPNIRLILCDQGGHVGFMQRGSKYTFVEKLAFDKFSGD
ncbi:MAG: alpha/beta fold hydrolase [Cytophagaceae bacterium]|nr:alpha/beta fold hydrolase [Cytophagaceae bacterium]